MSKFKNSDLISSISKTIKNPTVGLPDEIFLFREFYNSISLC